MVTITIKKILQKTQQCNFVFIFHQAYIEYMIIGDAMYLKTITLGEVNRKVVETAEG